MPFGNRKKNILENLFSSVLTQFKNDRPRGDLKINKLGVFQSLKFRIFTQKKIISKREESSQIDGAFSS